MPGRCGWRWGAVADSWSEFGIELDPHFSTSHSFDPFYQLKRLGNHHGGQGPGSGMNSEPLALVPSLFFLGLVCHPGGGVLVLEPVVLYSLELVEPCTYDLMSLRVSFFSVE